MRHERRLGEERGGGVEGVEMITFEEIRVGEMGEGRGRRERGGRSGGRKSEREKVALSEIVDLACGRTCME